MGVHKIQYMGSSIRTISSLAKTLDVSEIGLLKISSDIQQFYREFEKKVKNKTRNLAEPLQDLKIIQKKINSRIFSNIIFPHYLHGGIKAEDARDFVSNASSHSHAEIAVALDIKNFYPSISEQQVSYVFARLFKFSPEVSEILTKLVTLNGILPQGAPTSSYIANLVMFEREYKLASRLEGKGWTYTRLIDDITVSNKSNAAKKEITEVTNSVISMLTSYRFTIHPTKKFIYYRSNPKQLMVITGLWLNRGYPKVCRNQRKQICYEVAQLQKDALDPMYRTSPDFHEKHSSVSGKVALLQRMQHKEATRLRIILQNCLPLYDDHKVAKVRKLVHIICNKSHDRSKYGYIRKFYLLQHAISIVKRTNPHLGSRLQQQLNNNRPLCTLRTIYE